MEEALLEIVRDQNLTRKDIAFSYSLMLGTGIVWERINAAIKERWSASALGYIKTLAWKLAEERFATKQLQHAGEPS